jgi:hypothetical protein
MFTYLLKEVTKKLPGQGADMLTDHDVLLTIDLDAMVHVVVPESHCPPPSLQQAHPGTCQAHVLDAGHLGRHVATSERGYLHSVNKSS